LETEREIPVRQHHDSNNGFLWERTPLLRFTGTQILIQLVSFTLHSFFWAMHRHLNFMCWRFGTVWQSRPGYSTFLHRLWRWTE